MNCGDGGYNLVRDIDKEVKWSDYVIGWEV